MNADSCRHYVLARLGTPISILLLLTQPQRATASCPTNILDCAGVTTTSETRFNRDCENEYGGFSTGSGSTAYDLAAGTFAITAHAFAAQAPFTTSMQISDRYELAGSVIGEIDFAVELFIQSFVGGYGDAEVTMAESLNSVTFDAPHETANSRIRLPLRHVISEQFVLQFDFVAYGTEGGRGQVIAALSFVDLPAGVGVVSCQGFAQQPVDAIPSSWGRVKAGYR